jgi:D-threonate/D-erythronate kinase
MPSAAQSAPTCLLIADDLTGAADAGVQFTLRGRPTVVRLDATWADSCADVIAITTESRALSKSELRAVFTELAGEPAAAAPILFKKIDSTLRGNVGAELALALEVFGCDAALITPAFPAMGRTVEAGWLRVPRADFEPIEMAVYWRKQELACMHVDPSAVAAALTGGSTFISVDARCAEDLDAIARAGLASGKRLLWAGSGGLASALAQALPTGPEPAPPPPAGGSPALFCIGSNHPVTTEQYQRLVAARPALAINAATAAPGQLARTLRGHRHVALKIPYGKLGRARVVDLLSGLRAPLCLSGGDTASLVCRALGVRAIRLRDEIAPGIPRGWLCGGTFDGLTVATKSGGFGAPDALIQIADCLA